MSLPADFNKTTTVTVGLIVWIAAVSFSMGMIYKSILDNEKEHRAIEDYIEQEVGGLRKDWLLDKEEQDRRLIKLEK